MLFTSSTGKPLIQLRIGRAYNDEKHLVLEQADSRIAIPVEDICSLADALVDVDECLSYLAKKNHKA